MSNSINEKSPILRDNLLRYNLSFSDSVANYLQFTNGIGLPVNPYQLNPEVLPSTNLLITGDIEVNNIYKNKYLPYSLDRVNIEYNQNEFESIVGYSSNGKINGYEWINTRSDIANLINGDVIPDIYHTSLTTFLGVTSGVLKDNELGTVGNKELQKLIGYRVIQNGYKNTLGKINLNLSNLLSGGNVIAGNYTISVGQSFSLTSVTDPFLKLLGVENPYRELSNNSSFYSFENTNINISNESLFNQNNSLIKETGSGQSEVLKTLLNFNLDPKFNGGGIRYIPNYTIDGDKIESSKDKNDSYYDVDSNGGINKTKYKTLSKDNGIYSSYKIESGSNVVKPVESENIEKERFVTKPIFQVDYSEDPKSILDKTNKLFNDNKIKSIVGNKGTTDFEDSELITIHGNQRRWFNGNALSKGAQYIYLDKIKSGESDPNKYFCRSWVNGFSYDNVSSLQKNRGLDKNGGIRRNTDLSVLGDNGFVKITPNSDDKNDIKKYMFSIENLAWCNDLLNLPEWEIGNGDPLTGTRGRIMWFPPYDLNFSESTSVNYDTHQFIGRSEPMYTYNNSERTGQLSFKIIVDHPQYMNDEGIKNLYGEDYEDALQSLIVGCGEIPDIYGNALSESEKNVLEVESAVKEEVIAIEKETPPEGFNIYFPNDVAELGGTTNLNDIDSFVKTTGQGINKNDQVQKYGWGMYEVLGSSSSPWKTFWGETRTGKFHSGKTTSENGTYPDKYNYGLNAKWRNKAYLEELSDKLKNECPSCRVFITGYANTDGVESTNNKLAVARSKAALNFLKATILKDDVVDESIRFGSKLEFVKGGGESGKDNNLAIDSLNKKSNRFVTISFVPDVNVQESIKNKKIDEQGENLGDAKSKLAEILKKRFFNESAYFKKIELTSKISYDKISEKIKYFSPAFHSITPEGLNSRLTFLQQCTRQGSTSLDSSNRPNNMAFGMPPVCILRIGDFWNTKIIIDSVNIDYEQMWDVNPEGIGVQPMIANVNLSFKMLGGSTLSGPINKLQNAVSFNYYANTEMFDPRSDYFTTFISNDKIGQYGNTDINLEMTRGEYVNGMSDLYMYLNNKFKSKDETIDNKNTTESNTTSETQVALPSQVRTSTTTYKNDSFKSSKDDTILGWD